MDFWQQFASTMSGALAGALVAGTISSVIAWRTLVHQRRNAYQDRFDDALGRLFAAIGKRVSEADQAIGQPISITVEASYQAVVVEAERASLVARGDDAKIVAEVRRIVGWLTRWDALVVATQFPEVLTKLREWRTGVASTAETLADLSYFVPSNFPQR